MEKALQTFIHSCAGYSVATYALVSKVGVVGGGCG
jgi:hypothetical protein